MDSLKAFLTYTMAAGPIRLVVWEVLYIIGLVLALRAVLSAFLFRPVVGVLDERARRLDAARGSQDDTLREIERAQVEHADRLADARRRALALLESAKGEAEGQRKVEVDEARRRAEVRIGEARDAVAASAARAEADLTARSKVIARDIASRLLGREVA